MSINKPFLAVALLAACIAPRTFADEQDKRTVVTISGPVEIPGRVLPAGTYVFKVLDSQADRDILQIFDKDEQHLVADVMAVPDYRMRTPGKPILKFEEGSPHFPEALKSFFYPGDNYGLQFVYPHNQAVAIARRTNQNVLSTRNDEGAQGVENMKKADVTGVNPSGESVDMNGVVQTKPR